MGKVESKRVQPLAEDRNKGARRGVNKKELKKGKEEQNKGPTLKNHGDEATK